MPWSYFFLTLAGLVFITPFFTCRRRAIAELNLKPIWQEFCSGNMGVVVTNIPFIRIAIYDDFMVVGFINPNVIPYKKIGKVSINRKILFFTVSGVRLKLKGFRSSYFFNSRNPSVLAKLIKDRL